MSRTHDEHPRPGHGRAAGFSLVELLVATALGSLLMTALVLAADLFGQQVEAVHEETDHSLEEALFSVTEAVRHGWTVEREALDQLAVHDPYGRTTRFLLDAGSLQVQRPSGASGALLTGVADLAFGIDTMPRYREDDPVTLGGTLWSSQGTSVPGTGGALSIHTLDQPGAAVSLGFTLDTDAPSSVQTVTGVDEQLLEATPAELFMVLSRVDATGPAFCHVHAVHVDPHTCFFEAPTVRFALHEARAPGDPRPDGPALASFVLGTSSLPTDAHQWIDTVSGQPVVPPAGPDLAWWESHPEVQLAVASQASASTLVDLSALASGVEPGRAYAVVVTNLGHDLIRLQSRALPAAEPTTVATRSADGEPFSAAALIVPRTLAGDRTFTQTLSVDVVTRVNVSMTTETGQAITGSASVIGQTTVTDPWLGAVPGQVPDLQLESAP